MEPRESIMSIGPAPNGRAQDNANHESYFAPPQPTSLRLLLGTGGSELLGSQE